MVEDTEPIEIDSSLNFSNELNFEIVEIADTIVIDDVKEEETSFDFDMFRNKIEKSYKQISISRKMRKFYRRRYQLFNKFDSGILMDLESWYSVTPEATARHIASKCFNSMQSRSNLVVLDAFCGSGGNTIQFAKYFDRVISCDIDFIKLQCAQHNASIYNVKDKISFVMQDFFSLHKTLKDTKIDVIFLSPPWGGTSYQQYKQADMSEFPLDGFKIFLYCLNELKCKNIIYFLPRNSNLEQILYMAGPGGLVEIEQNFLDHKQVAISAYYGLLCNKT